MTKRTNTTKTTIYRRHAASCPIKEQPLNTANCECPLWIHGKVRGKFLRESLDTRTLSTAQARQTALENEHRDAEDGPKVVKITARGGETLEYAAAEFLAAKAKLRTRSVILYRRALEDFNQWAAKQELVLLKDVDPTHIRQYFEVNRGWKRNTVQGRLTHLRVFFNWCRKTRRWIQFTPTEDPNLDQPKKARKGSARVPFSTEQVTMILAAIERMPEEERDRARALIYLLLYTGMRISDATFCEREYLTPENDVEYYVIKTGRVIDLPPGAEQPLVDALAKLPPSRVYFFQPDRSDNYQEARQALRDGEEFGTLMPDYTSKITAATALVLKVLKLAGLKGTCHKFRDTFAISMLQGNGQEKGADIYTVSKMLGHSDVKITDAHYMKLVKGYRERMSKSTRCLAYQFPKAG